jgi:sugar/nucleoside kinase (ribokinase family)
VAITVVGSLALDDIQTPFGEVRDVLGGATSHFVMAASLYDRVNLVAVVGEDFPAEYLEWLRARDVDLQGLQVVPGKTFRWGTRYALDMNSRETLYTELGVFADFHPSVPPEYRRSEVVFLANIQPQLQLDVVRQAEAGGVKLRALDTMNLWIATEREALTEVLRHVDVVTMAEEEVRQYAGTTSLRTGARQILELGPRRLVIKQGSYGSLLLGADGSYFAAPSYPLEDVRDPTGAGDAFAGGFLGYLAVQLRAGRTLRTADYRRALIHGNILGSFSCEDYSVERLRTLTSADIEARYREFVRFTHFEGSWSEEG